MNISKFTQKSMEAVNNCEKLAYEYGNQQIVQEHLLLSLFTLEEGLIPKLLKKMDINTSQIENEVRQLLEKRPKVSGGQVYIGEDLNKVLIYAEDIAKRIVKKGKPDINNRLKSNHQVIQSGYDYNVLAQKISLVYEKLVKNDSEV